MVVRSLFLTMPPAWPILVLRCLRNPGLSAAREKTSVILDEAEAMLDPVSDIDGFMLACLVDASTGMVLASRKDQDDISLPTAAAGAADIANVLSLLAGELPVDGLEDVMVTFRRQTALKEAMTIDGAVGVCLV